MSGILNALIAGIQGIVRNFAPWNVTGDNIPGSVATATFTLNPDGTVTGLGTPNDFTSPGSTNWYKPSTGGIGANFWVRFTPTIGTLTSNGAATFTQLNAARSVTKSASSSAASCTFTIDIASDVGGTNIVFTSTGNVVGYTHT